MGGLVVAIAHVRPLAVLRRALQAGEVAKAGDVLQSDGPGLRKPSGRADGASYDLERGRGTRLPAQRQVQDRRSVGLPGDLHAASRGEEHDHVGVGGKDGAQKAHLVGAHPHVGAVEALHLPGLVQAKAEDHDLRASGEVDRRGGLLGVRPPRALKARLVAHEVKTVVGAHDIEEALYPRRIDQRRARPLVARCPGKVANERDLGVRGKGQQGRGARGNAPRSRPVGLCRRGDAPLPRVGWGVVLEEDDALLRGAPCKAVVGVRVVAAVVV